MKRNKKLLKRKKWYFIQETWQRFKKNKLAITGLLIIIFLMVIAIFAPFITPYNPNKPDLSFNGIPQTPDSKHIFGTDNYGRDVLSRAIFGSRISLSVGFVAVFILITIGILVGSISGYYGGLTDNLLMRLVDVLLCMPTFFLILIIQVMLKPSVLNVMFVIGFTGWAGAARLVRGQVLSIKEKQYIEAARAMGASNSRIIFKHILPNTWAPVIVLASLGIANTILIESALSFFGLGVQQPQASWGNMLQGAQEYMATSPWMAFFPGILIMITVLSFNFIGDGLRDALDPKLKI